MTEVNLEFIARQLERLQDDVAEMREDLKFIKAKFLELGRVLEELVRKLEET